jgi:predicted transcriptional regulator
MNTCVYLHTSAKDSILSSREHILAYQVFLMPESSINTHVETIVQHQQKVRSLLSLNPQRLTNIQVHLGLTKPQTLSVLQRLEEQGEIFCRDKVWRLTTSA